MNLQELAASLAEQAETHRTLPMPAGENALAFSAYHMGARDALLEVRATVLAMIEDVNRRIANNNRILNDDAWGQGRYDGRCEAYEDVRGDEPNDSGGS